MELNEISFLKETKNIELKNLTIDSLLNFIYSNEQIKVFDIGIIDGNYKAIFSYLKDFETNKYKIFLDKEIPNKYLKMKFDKIILNIFKVSFNEYIYIFYFKNENDSMLETKIDDKLTDKVDN